MLILDYDITNLRGADYNPRRIEKQDLEALAQSIKELGIVKPIIVRNDLIVAGHQRTKTLLSLGITKAPVFILSKDVTTYDEVRFNQLHNGTDMDGGDENVFLTCDFSNSPAGHFYTVQGKDITGNFKSQMAVVRKEICDLIVMYGAWGACVATKSGEVIHCAQYALAAHLTNTPVVVYVVEDDQKERYQHFLNKRYGVFSYDHLQKDTYIQTFAQLYRLRETPSGKQNKSTLYETQVIPYLMKNKKARCIDFGSGQGDYANLLRKQGFSIHDVELFRRKDNGLNMTAINGMIDTMIRDMKTHGPYDVVICDSVLNSVDCKDAEKAVVIILNFLCKMGGHLFVSGRNREFIDDLLKMRYIRGTTRYVQFMDDDGFSALYREGHWFYQKYHNKVQAEESIAPYGFDIRVHERKKSHTVWQIHAIKTEEIPIETLKWAIDFEFNLPIGKTRKLNRHNDVKSILEVLYG